MGGELKFLNIGHDFFAIDMILRVSSEMVARQGQPTVYRFEILFKDGRSTYLHVDGSEFKLLREHVLDQLCEKGVRFGEH